MPGTWARCALVKTEVRGALASEACANGKRPFVMSRHVVKRRSSSERARAHARVDEGEAKGWVTPRASPPVVPPARQRLPTQQVQPPANAPKARRETHLHLFLILLHAPPPAPVVPAGRARTRSKQRRRGAVPFDREHVLQGGGAFCALREGAGDRGRGGEWVSLRRWEGNGRGAYGREEGCESAFDGGHCGRLYMTDRVVRKRVMSYGGLYVLCLVRHDRQTRSGARALHCVISHQARQSACKLMIHTKSSIREWVGQVVQGRWERLVWQEILDVGLYDEHAALKHMMESRRDTNLSGAKRPSPLLPSVTQRCPRARRVIPSMAASIAPPLTRAHRGCGDCWLMRLPVWERRDGGIPLLCFACFPFLSFALLPFPPPHYIISSPIHPLDPSTTHPTMLRGRKDPLSGQQVRPIEPLPSERPAFKTYRPSTSLPFPTTPLPSRLPSPAPPIPRSLARSLAGGAAHSKGILVNPDTKSTLAIPQLNNRKFRKEHPRANDAAALDRLLAPQFQSGAVAVERQSFDYGGEAGPSRAGERLAGRSGSMRTHTSDGTAGDGVTSGGGRKRLLSGRRPRRRRRDESMASGGGGGGSDGEEQLTSRALGVYIDKQGRLHDKEYDPFETVRTVSRRKFEGRSAFGAAREDDSEAGSDVSGSMVGREQRYGAYAAYGRNGYGGSVYGYGPVDPAFEARDRRQVQNLQSRVVIGDEAPVVGKSWRNGDGDGDGDDDAMDRTVYSEYDSGISATSPKPGDAGRTSGSRMMDHLQVDARQAGSSSAASSSGSRASPHPSNKSRQHPLASVKTHASRLAQLEERPRSLLYPATPAQIAAQQERAKTKRGGARAGADLRAADPDVFIPPIAPFHPAYHPSGRPSTSRAPSLSSVERAISGRRGSYHSGHRAGEQQKPASTVFASHEMSYLPTRWARGDHEIRMGEEAIEKYRPLEWQGSQKAGVSGNGEPDWT